MMMTIISYLSYAKRIKMLFTMVKVTPKVKIPTQIMMQKPIKLKIKEYLTIFQILAKFHF